MPPHSSTLAWKIPWTEEPGRLQSMGSLRVGHDWATSLSCIGKGDGNPLQCSCLENPRGGGAWWAAIYGVTQSRTRLKQLSSSSWYIFCYAYLLMVYQYQWDFDFICFIMFEKKYWNYLWKYFFLRLPRLCPLFLGHQPHIIWKLLVLTHSWLRFSICLSYVFFFFLCISTWIVSIPISLINNFLLQGLICL